MNAIRLRIERAIKATAPRTKARNKALAAVRWVLITASGYAALSTDARCVVVPDIADAQVFDGRDNEETKAKFWTVQIGAPCIPQLLPA